MFLPIFSVDAQIHSVRDTFQINLDNLYKLTALNIVPFSENIYLKNRKLGKDDFKISYEKGIIILSPNLQYSIFDSLFVFYQAIRLNLTKEYKRRSLVYMYDDKLADTIKITKQESAQLTTESIFGKNMQKSGALVRGFTIGTNRDFTLNSGLRLQLSGKLSDDIELVAALTDENTPIQAEGNTETLEELDKVFIEIKHKNAVGTFGDYELNERDNEFSQITRKLQGLKGDFVYEKNRGVIAIAGSRGKFNTNQFNGFDGNQGPYRLYGINNERTIIVIAGSEKVYLDGEPLKRGENNDYIIDYSNSEITFTPKRLVTSASRISIDFEYTDQNYKRNFLGASFSTSLIDDKLKVGLSYYREGDNENNPIEFSFSEDDMNILLNAGDNRNNAVRSGVALAQPDSLGRVIGIYTKVDTTINQQQFTYYVYSPGSPAAVYNVSFTYVGQGSGDYAKESIGNYKFIGKGQGSYLPIIYLPLPELKQVANLSLDAAILKGINLNIELSGSEWDKNLFSSNDDSDNYGYARKFLLNVEPQEIRIGDIYFGKAGINLKERFIQSSYTTLDRIDAVEFNRYYNLSNVPVSDQILREAALSYLPIDNISILSKYGYLKQSESFKSNRFYNEVKLNNPRQYQFEYIIDYVKTENSFLKSYWNKQNGKALYNFGIVSPGIDFLYEDKEDKLNDSLLATSLRYIEAMPNIVFTPIQSLNINAGYSYREEYFLLQDKLEKQSKSYTLRFSAEYKGLKEFTTNLNITFRNKKFTEPFRNIGYGNNETVLFLSQSRFNLWNGFIQGDLYFQAATEQSARLEKVFVKVQKGTGSYIYLGDLNNNGIAEENEFQLTSYDGDYLVVTLPTDQLFPVIDLKTNTRWKLHFDKIITGNNLWSKALRSISTETFWRIEENSKIPDTKQIYLLNFSSFLNDTTTIRGSQLFQNDLHLFQNSNEFSVRLRFTQRKSLNQFSSGIERGYFKERGIRIKFRLIKEINNQTEFTNQIDNLISPISSGRARAVTRNDIVTDFSYRPVRNLEIGFKIQNGTSTDTYPLTPTEVDMNSITLRFNLSFENFGRLRVEAERTELASNNSEVNIPFEITRGNVIGKNYFWRAFFDYKLASYIQTSVSYDARLLGRSRVIHSMRAEARAYF